MVRSARMRRADPGAPDPTGRPSASGVLSAAPASRKRMPSTACHSMGCEEPEKAKGTVRTTSPAGQHRSRRAQVRRGVHPHDAQRRVERQEDGHHRDDGDRHRGDRGDRRPVRRDPRVGPPVRAVQRVETDRDQEGQEQREQRRELVGQDLFEDRQRRELAPGQPRVAQPCGRRRAGSPRARARRSARPGARAAR